MKKLPVIRTFDETSQKLRTRVYIIEYITKVFSKLAALYCAKTNYSVISLKYEFYSHNLVIIISLQS